MYRLALRKPTKCAAQRAVQQQNCRHFQKRNEAPPPVLEAGFGKLFLFASPLIAFGGVVTYAKYDKDFRKKIEQNVPGAESFIKVALLERKPFEEQIDSVKSTWSTVSKSVESATSTVTNLFGSSNDDNKAVVNIKTKPATEKSVAVSTSTPTTINKKTETAQTKPSIQTSTATPSRKVLDILPHDVIELEKAAEMAAALAVKEYSKAIAVLKNFNDEVRSVVEIAVEKVDPSSWTTLRNKTRARDSSVSTAEVLAHEALDKIEKCKIALSKIANEENRDQVVTINKKIEKLLEHIAKVKDELYQNKDIASLSEKYWTNVEKARNYFVNEIESLFPGINLNEKKLNISKDDLDLLILHAYTHVLANQKELQRLQTDGELRLKRAIEALRGDEAPDVVKAQLDYLLEAEKRKLAIENQRKIFQIRADADKQVRQQLKQQAEAHVDHLKDAIALKEIELKRHFTREYEDKLSTEKANYKLQLAAMLGKMRGMDSALQVRAEAERSAHQAQALWAACHALWSTVRSGDYGVHWTSKFRPLNNEIEAISKIGDGDELVNTILKNIPNEAKDRGVFSEDALRERFLTVERAARKVALVPAEGATMPMFLLSYLQSIFIMKPDDPISQDELQNKTFDYSKLDTYDILNRARYFVDRGDLIQALKYVNLLQGYSRKIANDWLRETRLTLETQQAANTLMAHAAASGLLYL